MWAVVPKNDQGDVFLLDEIQQFARAGNRFRSIGIHWTNRPVSHEMSLHGDGINGKKHRTGLREGDENRLVAGGMSTRLDEFDAGKQLRIAINKLVA